MFHWSQHIHTAGSAHNSKYDRSIKDLKAITPPSSQSLHTSMFSRNNNCEQMCTNNDKTVHSTVGQQQHYSFCRSILHEPLATSTQWNHAWRLPHYERTDALLNSVQAQSATQPAITKCSTLQKSFSTNVQGRCMVHILYFSFPTQFYIVGNESSWH